MEVSSRGTRPPFDPRLRHGLHDPGDGHVAHAALIGKADAIVTDDKPAGFKSASMPVEASIEIVSPTNSQRTPSPPTRKQGVQALIAMSQRRANPPQTPEQILDLLFSRYGMDEVAHILRSLLAELR